MMTLVFEHDGETVTPDEKGSPVQRYCWILQKLEGQLDGTQAKRAAVLKQFSDFVRADEDLAKSLDEALRLSDQTTMPMGNDYVTGCFMKGLRIDSSRLLIQTVPAGGENAPKMAFS